jgi:hypothetical protein
MVTVSAYASRLRKDGTSFITLELTGGLELIQSGSTGKFYATVRKCSIPSTFSELIAQKMIGQELPGEIVKQECDPYEFVNKQTGELMMLNHTYAYQASANDLVLGHTKITEMEMA